MVINNDPAFPHLQGLNDTVVATDFCNSILLIRTANSWKQGQVSHHFLKEETVVGTYGSCS